MVLVLALLAALIGLAVTVQSQVNAALAQRLPLPSVILLSALVTLAGATLWWLSAGAAARRMAPEGATPWWLYSGGLLGLFIISAAAFCFPRLGAGPTIALAVAAQLGAALAVDHLGVLGARLPVSTGQLVGAGLLLAGALLVLWPRLVRS